LLSSRISRRGNKAQPNNLYVKNFSNDVDEAILADMFQKYGEIASVKVMVDPATGKKFGYVCFKEEQAATDALEMHESACEPYSDGNSKGMQIFTKSIE
jgi:RNA recognition motif-containing protein